MLRAILILETGRFSEDGAPEEIRLVASTAPDVLRMLLGTLARELERSAAQWRELDEDAARSVERESEELRRFLAAILPAEALPEQFRRGG